MGEGGFGAGSVPSAFSGEPSSGRAASGSTAAAAVGGTLSGRSNSFVFGTEFWYVSLGVGTLLIEVSAVSCLGVAPVGLLRTNECSGEAASSSGATAAAALEALLRKRKREREARLLEDYVPLDPLDWRAKMI